MAALQTTKTPKKKRKGNCDCGICPSCVSMNCFERPRFFCGQLLTDKDLYAAQRYVIEKNKLHNRHVVGDGVVCGLAVRCDPCSTGTVTIEPGYAIDCCGNDIVLCESDEFDVQEFIEKCLTPEDECDGKIKTSSRCSELPREFCILVSYAEEEARPITAMIRDGNCSTTKCEPSRIRESHKFCLVEKSALDEKEDHSIWAHIRECSSVWLREIRKLGSALERQATTGHSIRGSSNHLAAHQLFCDIRAAVLDLYRSGPNIRCNLSAELDRIEAYFPPLELSETNRVEYEKSVYTTIFLAFGFMVEFLIDCFCEALLTPCPECAEPHGALLACVTVQNGQVQTVCNTVRKQVITGPRIRYWGEPLFDRLHSFFEYLCCGFSVVEYMEKILKVSPMEAEQVAGSLAAGKQAYKMAADYGGNFWTSTKSGVGAEWSSMKTKISVADLMNRDRVTMVDLYGLSVEDASKKLPNDVKIVEVPAKSREDAYNLKHLRTVSWIVPEGAKEVEMILDPETRLVTGIRVKEEPDEQ